MVGGWRGEVVGEGPTRAGRKGQAEAEWINEGQRGTPGLVRCPSVRGDRNSSGDGNKDSGMVDGYQQKVDETKLGFLVDPRNGGRLAGSQAIDRNEESGGGACSQTSWPTLLVYSQ